MQAFKAGLKGVQPLHSTQQPRIGPLKLALTSPSRITCRADDSGNGFSPTSKEQQQQQQQAAEASLNCSKADAITDADDPLEAMLYVAQQEMGMNVVWADPDEDEEELEDMLEELEDVWMRSPARAWLATSSRCDKALGILPASGLRTCQHVQFSTLHNSRT
jgi:hypothetical protein